jgi:hypothetical protein
MCVCVYTPHNQSCLDFHSKVLNGRIPKLPGLWISTRYILVCVCVCVCVCITVSGLWSAMPGDGRTEKVFRMQPERRRRRRL